MVQQKISIARVVVCRQSRVDTGMEGLRMGGIVGRGLGKLNMNRVMVVGPH